MDEFAERLADLANLSDEDLSALEQELVAAFQAADQGGDVDTMQALAEAIDQVRAEVAKRQGQGGEAPAEGAPPAPPAAPVPASGTPSPSPTPEEAPVTASSDEPTPSTPPPTEGPTEEAPEPSAQKPDEPPGQSDDKPGADPATPATPADPGTDPATPAEPATPATPPDPNAPEPEDPSTKPVPDPDPKTDETSDADSTTESDSPQTTDTTTDPDTQTAAADETDATSTSPSDESANPADPNPTESESDPTPEQEAEVAAEISTDIPSENQPTQAVAASPQPLVPTIRVGGDVPGYTAGAELPNFEAAIEAMTAKVNNLRGIGGDGEHILVASMRHELTQDEDHFLRQGDPDGNSRKIRQLISDPEKLTPEALLAAAWCAPSAPIYDVPTIGTTNRPIRDALPSFTADRGSINWMSPPSLPNEFNLVAGEGEDRHNATHSVWTEGATPGVNEAHEAYPVGNTNPTGTTPAGLKPCFDVPCGTEQNAALDALTICLCFDNLMARAFPEWIRANTELTMVAQARWAEQWLMHHLWSNLPSGTPCIIGTPDVVLGAARDFLTTVRLAASQFRWRNRIAPNAPLQLLVPSWLHDAIADDLTIQIPGDDKISISNAEIDGYLSDINVQPIWYIDDVPTGAGDATAVAAGANFDSYCGFPATAEWLLFPTGTFIRLDGGSLDLGVVRSKEDIQRNKYCEFSETFEGVAYMGPMDKDSAGSWVVRGQTKIEIRGGFAPAVPTIAAGGILAE